jgi:AraC-like DNA-binding protein
MQYLAEWRMTLARDHLRSGELALTQVADRTVYTSPHAFAAAFQRRRGQPPAVGDETSSSLRNATSGRSGVTLNGA